MAKPEFPNTRTQVTVGSKRASVEEFIQAGTAEEVRQLLADLSAQGHRIAGLQHQGFHHADRDDKRNLLYFAVWNHRPDIAALLIDAVREQGDDVRAFITARPTNSYESALTLAQSRKDDPKTYGVLKTAYKQAPALPQRESGWTQQDMENAQAMLRGLPVHIVGSPGKGMVDEAMPSVTLVSAAGEVLVTSIPRVDSHGEVHVWSVGMFPEDFDWARAALEQLGRDYHEIRKSEGVSAFKQFHARGGQIAITEGSESLYLQHVHSVKNEALAFSEDSIGHASTVTKGTEIIPYVAFNARYYGSPEHRRAETRGPDGKLIYRANTFAHEIFHTGDQESQLAMRHSKAALFKLTAALDEALEGEASVARITLEHVKKDTYPVEKYIVEQLARSGENFVANADRDHFSPLMQTYMREVYLSDAEDMVHDRKDRRLAAGLVLRKASASEIFGAELGKVVDVFMAGYQAYQERHHQLLEDYREYAQEQNPARRAALHPELARRHAELVEEYKHLVTPVHENAIPLRTAMIRHLAKFEQHVNAEVKHIQEERDRKPRVFSLQPEGQFRTISLLLREGNLRGWSR